jgi:hypothetical protein
MEPRREEPKAAKQRPGEKKPRPGEKPGRFRVIRLEERIAPTSFQWGIGRGISA